MSQTAIACCASSTGSHAAFSTATSGDRSAFTALRIGSRSLDFAASRPPEGFLRGSENASGPATTPAGTRAYQSASRSAPGGGAQTARDASTLPKVLLRQQLAPE